VSEKPLRVSIMLSHVVYLVRSESHLTMRYGKQREETERDRDMHAARRHAERSWYFYSPQNWLTNCPLSHLNKKIYFLHVNDRSTKCNRLEVFARDGGRLLTHPSSTNSQKISHITTRNKGINVD
jgi:hypothetical protein